MVYCYNICIGRCKLTWLDSETYNDGTLMAKITLQVDGSRLKIDIVNKQEEYKDQKIETNTGTRILRKIIKQGYKNISI